MFCNNISGNAISRKPDSEAKVRSLIETRNTEMIFSQHRHLLKIF